MGQKIVLVEIVLVETILVGDPLYLKAKIFPTLYPLLESLTTRIAILQRRLHTTATNNNVTFHH